MKMDIAVIVIFALTMFLSMRRGFLFTVAGFFKGIASVIAAYLLCGPLGNLIEGSALGEGTEYRISEYLTTRWEESELYQAMPAIFRGDEGSASSGFIADTAQEINHVAWIVLSFIIILVVIRILVGLLINIAKTSREKDGFTGTLDWLLGLAMGVVIGIFVVFTFLALLFPVSSLIAPGHAQEIMTWFDGSFFAQDLYDNNLVLLIFSNLFQ